MKQTTTKKVYKLRKEIKATINILISIFFIISIIIIIGNIKEDIKQQQQKEAESNKQYLQCIINQSKNQGYIIRSVCSANYKEYDAKNNIKYKQVKKDIYLISINDIEL